MKFKYKWWGKGDIDASFGIFFDGFSKILLPPELCYLFLECRQKLFSVRLYLESDLQFLREIYGISMKPGR